MNIKQYFISEYISTNKMEKVIKTNACNVTINPHTGIVRKTYLIEHDSMFDTPIGSLTTELVILNLLNGTDGFPRVLDFEIEPSKYTIVMNYVGKRISKSEKPIELFTKILQRVAVLHNHHIVHCDLKPENIMIDDKGNISIIDFTHSYLSINQKDVSMFDKTDYRCYLHTNGEHMEIYSTDVYTTRIYGSPENYDGYSLKSSSCDIWALGCVLYAIITGKSFLDDDVTLECEQETHYNNSMDDKQIVDIIKKKFADVRWMSNRIDSIDDKLCRKILHDTLTIDPAKRPTVKQLLEDYIGVKYEIPTIFNDTIKIDKYCCTKNRMRCFDLPTPLNYFVDKLIDHFVIKLCDEEVSKEPDFESYDKKEPMKKISAYQIYWISHLIIAMLFCDKYKYTPYDTLSRGIEYMTVLSDIIKSYNLSFIFCKSVYE